MQGKLIVFEGIEGSGKTTQIQQLYDWLVNSELLHQLRSHHALKGVLLTREPGGTSLGQQIRSLLLTPPPDTALHSRTELLLYAADRAQHVTESLKPALEDGYLVLCDRYTDSTVAYQGYGRQLDLTLIHQLNQMATAGLESDLTLWLKLDATVGLARLHARGQADRIEQSGLAFHQRVQAGFEALAQQHPHRFVTINGDQPAAAIATQIRTLIQKFLLQWYPLSPLPPSVPS
jgi:dTMP kinase